LNATLLARGLPILITVAYALIEPLRHYLRADAAALLIFIVLDLALWVWAMVGVFRSANRHTARGGSRFWANAARVVVCISVIATAVNLYRTIIPGMSSLESIAAGRDSLDTLSVEVSQDGRSIMLDGTLGEGSIAKVQKVLDDSPDAATLILNSDGGRESAAEEIALRVRQRRLNTLVEDRCLSACTVVFLAGLKRELAEDADLGFHQGTVDGATTFQQSIFNARAAEYYRSQGLRQGFIDHINATPPEDMWYPTRDELKEGGVLN
jgi:hypothetical protein